VPRFVSRAAPAKPPSRTEEPAESTSSDVPVAPLTIPSNRTRAAASVVRTATAAASVTLPAYVWLPGVVTFAPSVIAGEPISTPPAAATIALEITVASIVEATVSGSAIG